MLRKGSAAWDVTEGLAPAEGLKPLILAVVLLLANFYDLRSCNIQCRWS